MSRYYDVLTDDKRRCNRCERRSQIFGDRDVDSGWIGYCRVCNKEWYSWYLAYNIRLCDRRCDVIGLFQMLQSNAAVEITTEFVLGPQRPEDVLMADSLRHLFDLVQLSWLSCPLEWYYEEEWCTLEWCRAHWSAEEERRQRPILRTLREVKHVNSVCNLSDNHIERPCLLDLVCTFLYCNQVVNSWRGSRGSLYESA